MGHILDPCRRSTSEGDTYRYQLLVDDICNTAGTWQNSPRGLHDSNANPVDNKLSLRLASHGGVFGCAQHHKQKEGN